jgi:serine/threonine protein kinase
MKFTFAPESRPLDGFTIKRAIHRGGFGEVYYAVSDAGKEVALKLLHSQPEVELRGVRQCLNLKHPNLVTLFDIRTDDDDESWVVMEYVSGRTLADAVEKYPEGMPAEDVLRWLEGMTAGLGFLHDRGIVHRDLKPANVYIDQQVVKIGDIGLSKSISNSRRNEQTQSVGTVYYMAPEVAHGRYGYEVDIYSLGIVLYEMITGRVPFDGETAGEILMKHLSAQPDLSPLPPRLRAVLAHALQKDPSRRTADAAELLSEFRRALRGETIAEEIPDESFVQAAEPVPVQERVPTRPQRVESAQRSSSPWVADETRQEHRDSPRAKPHVWERYDTSSWWWRAGLWSLLLLVLIAPGAVFGATTVLVRVGIMLALMYGAFRLFAFFLASLGAVLDNRREDTRRRVVHGGDSRDNPRNGHTGQPVAATASRRRNGRRHDGFAGRERSWVGRTLRPETQRWIPFRHRMAELTGSLAYAVFITGAITLGLCLVTPSFFGVTADFGSTTEHALSPGGVALFALTTILGAWAILIPSKLAEGSASDSGRRRFSQLMTGAVVGGAAYWLDRLLMVDLRYDLWGRSDNVYSAFSALGVQPLTESIMQPALLAYVVFFAGLFWLRSWWRHADAFRPKRFRLSSVLLTTLLGFGLPLLFAFPHGWGVMWAVAISSVVQLSAAWVPPEDRHRLLEGCDHV